VQSFHAFLGSNRLAYHVRKIAFRVESSVASLNQIVWPTMEGNDSPTGKGSNTPQALGPLDLDVLTLSGVQQVSC
jgi:hypothetical protein